MVIKMKPFMIKCQAFGWAKIVSPRSDVLMESDFVEIFSVC